MTLTRWNPGRDMLRLRDEFDRLFDETFNFTRRGLLEPNGGPALDVAEQDDAYVVKASLPGIKPEELDVSITDNILTIKGEMKREDTISEEQYVLRERRYGAFTRSINLPTSVDVDAVEANYADGVLTLNVPKSEDTRRKQIAVRSVESTKMLEGESGDK